MCLGLYSIGNLVSFDMNNCLSVHATLGKKRFSSNITSSKSSLHFKCKHSMQQIFSNKCKRTCRRPFARPLPFTCFRRTNQHHHHHHHYRHRPTTSSSRSGRNRAICNSKYEVHKGGDDLLRQKVPRSSGAGAEPPAIERSLLGRGYDLMDAERQRGIGKGGRLMASSVTYSPPAWEACGGWGQR